MTKFSQAEEAKIIENYKEQRKINNKFHSCLELAKKYNCHHTTIQKIVNGCINDPKQVILNSQEKIESFIKDYNELKLNCTSKNQLYILLNKIYNGSKTTFRRYEKKYGLEFCNGNSNANNDIE